MNVSTIVVISFTVLIISYMYLNYRKMKNTPLVADSENIKELNDQNFQNQIKSGLVLVDFWAAWCMPCKMMAPILNEVAEGSSNKYTVAKLNVEHNQNTSSKFSVRSIPTLILFKDGKEINRFVGMKSKDFLIKELAKY